MILDRRKTIQGRIDTDLISSDADGKDVDDK